MELINFRNNKIAQDLVNVLLEDSTGANVQKVISSAINKSTLDDIMSNASWIDTSYTLWENYKNGREWYELEEPVICLTLSDNKTKLLRKVEKALGVSTSTAVSYFLLYSVKQLGYHL